MTDLSSNIRQVIEGEDVALFMKGTPQMVMCGNSMRALEALRRAGAPVTAVDVLPDPAIRLERTLEDKLGPDFRDEREEKTLAVTSFAAP